MRKEQNDTLLKDLLLFILQKEKNRWIKSKVFIKNHPEFKREAEVRRIINILRSEGVPIVSGKWGYNYCEDMTQVRLYTLALKNRIREMLNAYNGLVDYCGLKDPEFYGNRTSDFINFK